jgi:hypothetical protein
MRAQVPAQQSIVVLNLDETSCRFYYPPRPGLKLKKKALPKRRLACRRQASKGHQRKAFTYVSVICDDQRVQKQLPQFILISDKMCSKRDVDSATGFMPSRVHVWREKSGWVNIPIFARMVRLIGSQLRAAAPGAKPFLFMDAHKIHYSLPVLRAARLFGITVLIIPATCTHVMQMLDTDVFARFKHDFRNRLQKHYAVGANADLPANVILTELGKTIREIVSENDWADVFRKNGFGRTEPFARPSLLQALEYEALPELPVVLPSYAAFCSLFPRGAVIPFDLLLNPTPARTAVDAPDPVEIVGPPTGLETTAPDWSTRLRPRRPGTVHNERHSDELPEAASASGPPPPPPLPPPAHEPPADSSIVRLRRLGSLRRALDVAADSSL